ncbi:PKD domain-containing protein [Thermus sp.]|uniref:PKD domain-containing protein n=1 Tax=Thermus sp. TaxID=275 RepID=UPI00298EE25D|nr:PKD domain-containing protein [Thermus sp.]
MPVLQFLRHYGVPLESDMPYVPDGRIQEIRAEGGQWEVDRINLEARRQRVRVGDLELELEPLPVRALLNARYAPIRVRAIELNLQAFKEALARGETIGFGARLPCEESGEFTPQGVWRSTRRFDGSPGTGCGAHAMAIVGYDDRQNAFLVKNSWGRDDSGRARPVAADPDRDGFIAISYNWFEHQRIYEAWVIPRGGTRDPTKDLHKPKFLGMWKLFMGTAGENLIDNQRQLNIYHLPYGLPRRAKPIGNEEDRRLGTLYSGPGRPTNRVNAHTLLAIGGLPDGTFQDGSSTTEAQERQIAFAWDRSKPNLNNEELPRDMRFLGMLLRQSPAILEGNDGLLVVGWYREGSPGAGWRPFLMYRTTYTSFPAGVRRGVTPTGPLASGWVGTWDFSSNRLGRGRLIIDEVDATSLSLRGRFQAQGETRDHPVEGRVDAITGSIVFTINHGGERYEYLGATYPEERALASGTSPTTLPGPTWEPTSRTRVNDLPLTDAFLALRVNNAPPRVRILSPRRDEAFSWRRPIPFIYELVENTGDHRGQSREATWHLPPSTTIPAASPGERAEYRDRNMPLGNQTLTLRYRDALGQAEASVSFSIRNDPPSVRILEPVPSPNNPFCVGSPIRFRAEVSDPNNDPASFPFPEANVVWRVAGEVIGTGLTKTHTFTRAGTYVVTVEATDDAPPPHTLSARDTLNLAVNNCGGNNRPPTASITNPPQDSSFGATGGDNHGQYYELTLRGQATDPDGDALIYRWFTDRGDLQPGPPDSGPQFLGTGPNLPVRLYAQCGRNPTHQITLEVSDGIHYVRVLRRISVIPLC